jgi:hypothetical protein
VGGFRATRWAFRFGRPWPSHWVLRPNSKGPLWEGSWPHTGPLDLGGLGPAIGYLGQVLKVHCGGFRATHWAFRFGRPWSSHCVFRPNSKGPLWEGSGPHTGPLDLGGLGPAIGCLGQILKVHCGRVQGHTLGL